VYCKCFIKTFLQLTETVITSYLHLRSVIDIVGMVKIDNMFMLSM